MILEIHFAASRFREEMERVDELAHVLLKGHLLIEESLARIHDQYVFHREYVGEARLTFNQKMNLVRSLCLRKCDFGEWDLIASINSLRNELAHRLQSPEREKRFSKVKAIYLREIAQSAELVEVVKRQTDANVLMNAMAHCTGFLARFEADSKLFRGMVHAMDRELNPGLPEFDL